MKKRIYVSPQSHVVEVLTDHVIVTSSIVVNNSETSADAVMSNTYRGPIWW